MKIILFVILSMIVGCSLFFPEPSAEEQKIIQFMKNSSKSYLMFCDYKSLKPDETCQNRIDQFLMDSTISEGERFFVINKVMHPYLWIEYFEGDSIRVLNFSME